MGTRRVLVIGHTADWMEIDSYIQDLEEAGYECVIITSPKAELGIKPMEPIDVIVLCAE